ncbi:MAG: undecaprenyldiphospho-muramoylpentapeptide beta-N-acetylglucosaminyltransferase [Negativicutes bacterium]|nr:undecaprenyldiphospho-muramoylpentapeptide beta-N-acetylglucosaminyltransferase [Negativicutes bacterium]
MRLVVTGGGTGGHINPAIALIKELQARPEPLQVLYLGTQRGMESELVMQEGIPFSVISSRGFQRKISVDTLKTIVTAANGFFQAHAYLKEFRPDVAVGTGGYVAGPVILQAALMGIPTLIHEQNALPSLTNRLLARFVTSIALSYPESSRYFPDNKPQYVIGNPVRPEIMATGRAEAIERLALNPELKTLLVVGGSRGAEPINEAVLAVLPDYLCQSGQQVIFATGKAHFAKIAAKLDALGYLRHKNLHLLPYLFDMAAGLQAADLIISRSGGMIAEINLVGIPAIYIPSPHVADNHQEYNARAIESQGAGVMIREKDLTPTLLLQTINRILFDEEESQRMRQAALAMAKPDATRQFADLACQIAKKQQ